MGLLFIKTSPVKQYSYQNDFFALSCIATKYTEHNHLRILKSHFWSSSPFYVHFILKEQVVCNCRYVMCVLTSLSIFRKRTTLVKEPERATIINHSYEEEKVHKVPYTSILTATYFLQRLNGQLRWLIRVKVRLNELWTCVEINPSRTISRSTITKGNRQLEIMHRIKKFSFSLTVVPSRQ